VVPQSNSGLCHLFVGVYTSKSHAIRNTHTHTTVLTHMHAYTNKCERGRARRVGPSGREIGSPQRPLPEQHTANTRELVGLQRDSKPRSHQSSRQMPLKYKPNNCTLPVLCIYGLEQSYHSRLSDLPKGQVTDKAWFISLQQQEGFLNLSPKVTWLQHKANNLSV
jgi:hypothetical protein